MYDNINIKKVCSFCVSDLHLITMLLPYLDSKIKDNEKFITILEKDLTKQIELVLSKLTLNNEDKDNLLNIGWSSNKISNIDEITDKVNVIVGGSKEYIEEANRVLEKNKHSNFKIINCYDITELDEDIKAILKTHDAILNTSGEKEIADVFEGYEKRKLA